jgi:DNA polymerase III subunit gamma/tau
MIVNLALKYRPITFDQIIGQDHIVNILKRAVVGEISINPLYIFVGSSGIGKTTTARVFARALNCKNRIGYNPCNECVSCKADLKQKHPDTIEYDGGSMRSVDDVDKMKNTLIYKPLLGQYRIIIIDECQDMSNLARDSLLKTFEQPPPNTIFILGTTEPGKLKDTITGRGKKGYFEFNSGGFIEIQSILENIVNLEKFKVGSDTLGYISESSNGSIREAILNLEKLVDSADTSLENCKKLIKMVVPGDAVKLLKMIVSKQAINNANDLAYQIMQEGVSGYDLVISLIENSANYLREGKVKDNAVITDVLNVRHFCLLELPFIKNFGSKWSPVRDLIYVLYNRPIYEAKPKSEKFLIDDKKKLILDNIAKAIKGVVATKKDWIEIQLISGKIIYVKENSDWLKAGDYFILLENLQTLWDYLLKNQDSPNLSSKLKEEKLIQVKE